MKAMNCRNGMIRDFNRSLRSVTLRSLIPFTQSFLPCAALHSVTFAVRALLRPLCFHRSVHSSFVYTHSNSLTQHHFVYGRFIPISFNHSFLLSFRQTFVYLHSISSFLTHGHSLVHSTNYIHHFIQFMLHFICVYYNYLRFTILL